MKKLIGITTVVSLLSSCGLTFGNYDHYLEVYGEEQPCIKSYCITLELDEISNTAEDMIEWIAHDVESGKLDSSIAQTYVYNLNQIIKSIDNE